MATWDNEIFTEDAAQDFLDEVADLDDDDDIVAAIADACTVALKDSRATDDDIIQGRAAATIAAIWAGAPYFAGDIVVDYPFIRDLIGSCDVDLAADACALLEAVADENSDRDDDLDSFIEALTTAE